MDLTPFYSRRSESRDLRVMTFMSHVNFDKASKMPFWIYTLRKIEEDGMCIRSSNVNQPLYSSYILVNFYTKHLFSV